MNIIAVLKSRLAFEEAVFICFGMAGNAISITRIHTVITSTPYMYLCFENDKKMSQTFIRILSFFFNRKNRSTLHRHVNVTVTIKWASL